MIRLKVPNRKWGIDRNHPAGRPVASWVTELPCSPSSDVFRSQHAKLGSTWTLPTMANGTTNQITVGSANNGNTVTWACIVANVTGNGGRAWIANEGGDRGLACNGGASCYTNVTKPLLQVGPATLSGSYFYAFSYTDNAPWYGVRTNLETGQVYAASGTLGLGAVATGENFSVTFIGKLWNNNEHATFQIAAFAKTLTQMRPQEMLNWAYDPWSFWRPTNNVISIRRVGSGSSPPPPPPDTSKVRLLGLADVEF